MTTRRKLNLINGTIDTEGDIQILQSANSLKVNCPSGWPSVPPLPFPADDDWDDFEQAE